MPRDPVQLPPPKPGRARTVLCAVIVVLVVQGIVYVVLDRYF